MNNDARILIVEDEAISAMWLETQLSRDGYTILGIVDNGSDAIRAAEQQHPDIVLMDIRLAGPMDGIEAARVITRQCHCSVIFMSGYSDQLVRLQNEGLTSSGYLSKPIQMPELERLLTQVS
ncbi:MAG: response regulator [Spirochaetota bacterium]